MGTNEDIFRVLELRAKEVVKQMNLLKEENTKIKLQNKELLGQQDKTRLKVRELLNKLSN